jgi:IS1 family transposase/transposase-like protein
MIPTLFCYQVVLVGLVWLFFLLYWLRPTDSGIRGQTIVKPTLLRCKHPRERQPFMGLTRKPHCAACAQEATRPKPPPPIPPDPLPATHRRPRTVNTSMHYCPQPNCTYHGWVGRGNLRANGHPNGGQERQFHCTACAGYFLESHGTLFYGKRVAPEKLVWAIAALAEGLGIRAVARVFEVDPNTVLSWLVEAAAHLEAFSGHFVRNVQVDQVQLDELFALLSAVKEGEVSEAQALKRLARSLHWVWVAMDPVTKLILTIEVGERTLAMAQRVVHQLVQVLAPACVPLLLTDGYKGYFSAILAHFGLWVQPERKQAQGPAPKPRWMALPELLYAQVVKQYRRRRLVGMRHRVVFGPRKTVEHVLAKQGWQINTAFVERLNLDLRQHVAAIGRRVNTLCKHESGLRQQLAIFQVYHNFVLPHASLRQPLPQPEPTHGAGSAKQWRPWTPAMAAGVTDRVWSLHEVLRFRVPPWPQPQRR